LHLVYYRVPETFHGRFDYGPAESGQPMQFDLGMVGDFAAVLGRVPDGDVVGGGRGLVAAD